MLRVDTQESDGALICRLEGRFTGAGAEQVRTLTTRSDGKLRLIVDLTEMLFVDAVGEEVLSLLKRLGAHFIADTAYSGDVCERLGLPLLRQHKSKIRVPGNSNGKSCHSDIEVRRG